MSISNFVLKDSNGNVVTSVSADGGDYTISGTLSLSGNFSSYSTFHVITEVLAEGMLFGIIPFSSVECFLDPASNW